MLRLCLFIGKIVGAIMNGVTKDFKYIIFYYLLKYFKLL